MTSKGRRFARGHSPEYVAQQKANLEQKGIVTGRISETCRYICFGLLALFYSLHTAKPDDGATRLLNQAPRLLTLMAVLAVLAVLADYLQYFFGSRQVNRALKTYNQLYDRKWWSYRLREICFQSKQYLTIAAVMILLFVMVIYLLQGPTAPAAPITRP